MEPAAIRHKNPGAMWPGAIATKWGSKKWVYLNDGTGQGGNGKGNKIATFDTWVDGICAQLDLWRTSKNYKNKTFGEAIAIWSGHNNVPSYIKYVTQRIPGMSEATIMNDAFWSSPNGIKFLKVQAQHEAGKAIPAPEADYVEAQRRVFSGMPPKAPVSPAGALVVVVATTTAVTAVPASGLPVGAAIAIGLGSLLLVGLWYAYRNWSRAQAFEKAQNEIQERNGTLPPERVILRGDDPQ